MLRWMFHIYYLKFNYLKFKLINFKLLILVYNVTMHLLSFQDLPSLPIFHYPDSSVKYPRSQICQIVLKIINFLSSMRCYAIYRMVLQFSRMMKCFLFKKKSSIDIKWSRDDIVFATGLTTFSLNKCWMRN